MNDTTPDIKKKQLEIWLAKSPGERLMQFIIDNDAMFKALNEFKKSSDKNESQKNVKK